MSRRLRRETLLVLNVPQAASSSCNKDEGISGGGASAPSVNEKIGDASEPSKASAGNPAASPPTQSTDGTGEPCPHLMQLRQQTPQSRQKKGSNSGAPAMIGSGSPQD